MNRLFNSSFWVHTPSAENPADLVTRGCTAQSLLHSSLWLKGPSWILTAMSWPQLPKSPSLSAAVAVSIADQQIVLSPPNFCTIMDVCHFNRYSCLLATSVYVHHFCFHRGIKEPPTTLEINFAETQWIRAQQQEFFPQVLDFLSTSYAVAAHTPPILCQFNAFLDGDRLTCAKRHFALTSSLILLPQHSRFTDLLILDCHHHMHHISVGGTIVALHNRFWVPAAHATACCLPRKCTRCSKATGHHYMSPMSPELPQFRQGTSRRLFSNIGVEFTSHLTVKDHSGNHIKVYICLFTCLTTRAINFEIVEDLSTSSYLQALRQHCSIFSAPQLILSNNTQIS